MANPEHLEIIKQGVEAWNKWREEHPRVRPDLKGANLRWADLTRAGLYSADLNEADLNEAYLSRAGLTITDLRGASIRGTDLNEAYLIGADLTGADLTGAQIARAYLIEANLTGAYLSRTMLSYTAFSSATVAQADFTEAQLDNTIFANMDLSKTKGLETVLHLGRSTIGVETILRSKGEIPEIFLRGVGIPDDMISYIRTLRGKAIEFYSCFISYSHKDKVFARRLHDTLQGRGIRCWLDEHQILPGADIFEEIDRGIKLWDKVLLCCSEDSLTSWWVDNEIKTAFGKEQALMKQRGKKVLALIPLNLDGYLFQWERGSMAQEVKSRMAADFRGWEHDNSVFEAQFERLVGALRAGDEGREPPQPPRL
jgi:hypothetical protein